MNLELSKEWYDRNIEAEGDFEIEVEFILSHDHPVGTFRDDSNDIRIAFGQFVSLWRRSKGWSAERLADEAHIDPAEVLEIEHDPHCQPEVDAVCKLASVFEIQPRRLLQLAGLASTENRAFREKAIRFAARSESVSALTEIERQTFEAFVAVLAENSQ